jgi:hypothetical protein
MNNDTTILPYRASAEAHARWKFIRDYYHLDTANDAEAQKLKDEIFAIVEGEAALAVEAALASKQSGDDEPELLAARLMDWYRRRADEEIAALKTTATSKRK